eukprot:8860511-Prorocentrum_lima.AAC.1
MTSSLVGSEMCIRDRALKDWETFHLKDQCLTSKVPALLGLRTIEAPVSYTHLTLPTICSV